MLMTKEEALKMYLENGYDVLMPFESKYEHSFINTLESMGVKIVDDNEWTDASYERGN